MNTEPSRGQFFIDAPVAALGSTMYLWTRHLTPDNDYPVYVMVEADEVTFGTYGYDTDKKLVTKETLLVIPYDRTDAGERQTKIWLEDLYNRPLDKNTKLKFHAVFLDFLWDLQAHQAFASSGHQRQLQKVVYEYRFIYGLLLKLLFFQYVKPTDIAEVNNHDPYQVPRFTGQEGPLYDDFLRKARTEAIKNWGMYLSRDENEVFFTDEKYTPESPHWFRPAEEELKLVLNAARSDEFIDIKEPDVFTTEVSRFLLKRYAFRTVVRYMLDGGKYVDFLILFYILVFGGFIVLGTLLFNYGNPKCLFNCNAWLAFILLSVPLFYGFILTVLGLYRSIVKRKNGHLQERKKTSHHRLTIGIILPNLFLPRMTIAILSGWLVFLTTEELLRIDFDIHIKFILGITAALLFLLTIFMYNELKGIAVSLLPYRILQRIWLIMITGFCISYAFGLVFTLFISQQMLERGDILQGLYNVKERSELSNEVLVLSRASSTIQTALLTINGLGHITERMQSYARPVLAENLVVQTDTAGRAVVTRKHVSLLDVPLQSRVRILKQERNEVSHALKYLALIDSTDIHWRMCEQLHRIIVNTNSFKNTLDTLVKDSVRLNVKEIDAIMYQIEDRTRSIAMHLGELFHDVEQARILKTKQLDDYNDLDSLQQAYRIDTTKVKAIQCMPLSFMQKHYHTSQSVATQNTQMLIMPNVLFLRAAIAMFIGIFFQLIIQDKSITESL